MACASHLATPGSCYSFRALILRHGQTDANARGVEQGSADFSRLTELGRRQASDAYGAFLEDGGERIASVYSSPLTRVRETLRQLRRRDEESSPHGGGLFPPEDVLLDELREIDLYDWQGQTYDALEARFPSSWKAWREGDPDGLIVYDTGDAADAPTPRYPLREVWERADRAWDEIFLRERRRRTRSPSAEEEDDAKEDGGGGEGSGRRRTALIVAHGNLGQALLGTAMGWDATHFHVHDFPNCGMAEIDFSHWQSRPRIADRWRWKWPASATSEWRYAASSVLEDICDR